MRKRIGKLCEYTFLKYTFLTITNEMFYTRKINTWIINAISVFLWLERLIRTFLNIRKHWWIWRFQLRTQTHIRAISESSFLQGGCCGGESESSSDGNRHLVEWRDLLYVVIQVKPHPGTNGMLNTERIRGDCDDGDADVFPGHVLQVTRKAAKQSQQGDYPLYGHENLVEALY